MKTITIGLLAGLWLGIPTVAPAADALQPLNIRPEAAKKAVFDTFNRGYASLPAGYTAFWVLDDTRRAALVPPLLGFVRGYVESAEFAAQLGEAHQGSFLETAKSTRPANDRQARRLIADRLQEFLDQSADVDFNARMVSKDGKLCFADPALESKPAEWKLCYRAGPKTLAAARGVAQQWLKDVGSKDVAAKDVGGSK